MGHGAWNMKQVSEPFSLPLVPCPVPLTHVRE
jgi:hypothetical protein